MNRHPVVLRVILFFYFVNFDFDIFCFTRPQLLYFAIVLGLEEVNIATAQYNAKTICGNSPQRLLNGPFKIDGGSCFLK